MKPSPVTRWGSLLSLLLLVGCRSPNANDNWFNKPQGAGNFAPATSAGQYGAGAYGNSSPWYGNNSNQNTNPANNFGGGSNIPAGNPRGNMPTSPPTTSVPGGNPATYNGANWQAPFATPGINPQNTFGQPSTFGQPAKNGQFGALGNAGQPNTFGQPNNYGQPTGNQSGFNGGTSTNPLGQMFQNMTQWWNKPSSNQSNYNRPGYGVTGMNVGQPPANSPWNPNSAALPFPVSTNDNRFATAPAGIGNGNFGISPNTGGPSNSGWGAAPGFNSGASANAGNFGAGLPPTGAVISRSNDLNLPSKGTRPITAGNETAPRIVEPPAGGSSLSTVVPLRGMPTIDATRSYSAAPRINPSANPYMGGRNGFSASTAAPIANSAGNSGGNGLMEITSLPTARGTGPAGAPVRQPRY